MSAQETPVAGTPRLLNKYRDQVAPELLKSFQYGNPMRIPRVEKVVLNMGVGEATRSAKLIEGAVSDMTRISGMKPVVTRARKSVSNFRLREGMPIGCKVTLRGVRMYEFLDKLISVAIPRIRDFRGILTKSFDGRGNYTLGVTEQIIFPEIEYDEIDQVRGMDISIVTTAKTDEEALALLTALGMPFRQN